MRPVLYIILIIQILLPSMAAGQDAANRIENIRLSVVNNRIRIEYDITGLQDDTIHNIKLSFITRENEVMVPGKLSGDIGDGVTSGNGKAIYWDYTADMDDFNTGLRPYIIIDGTGSTESIKGGPENMFLSLLLPGLGDYFVASPRDMKFKPYLRTISSAAMLGIGYYAASKRYTDTFESTVTRRFWTPETGPYWVEEKVILQGDTHYRFFKHDAEIFYTVGAAIWITDILWVLNKGYQNSILSKSLQNSNLNLDIVPGGAALTLTF